MRISSQLKGVDTVLRNLNFAFENIRDGSKKAIRTALLSVKGLTMVYTPVDTSFLISGIYTLVDDSSGTVIGEIGFVASYAPYVHEMPGTYNFKKPGSGPKFLERALYEKAVEIAEILQAELKVEGSGISANRDIWKG